MKRTLLISLLCLLLACMLVFTTACGTDGEEATPERPGGQRANHPRSGRR